MEAVARLAMGCPITALERRATGAYTEKGKYRVIWIFTDGTTCRQSRGSNIVSEGVVEVGEGSGKEALRSQSQ